MTLDLSGALRQIATLVKWELISAGPPAKVKVVVGSAQRINAYRVNGPRDYRA